jgi:hypothetical protein
VWRVLVPDGHLGEFGPAARTVFGFSAGVVGGGLIGFAIGWLLSSRWAYVWRYGHRRLILVDPFLDPNELDRRAGL